MGMILSGCKFGEFRKPIPFRIGNEQQTEGDQWEKQFQSQAHGSNRDFLSGCFIKESYDSYIGPPNSSRPSF